MPKYLNKFRLKVNDKVIKNTVARAKERNVIIPTFAQQRNPDLIPDKVKKQVQPLGLWDVNPRNLFRITWKNNTKTGLYGDVNFVELPSSLTGVKGPHRRSRRQVFPDRCSQGRCSFQLSCSETRQR